jgi:hypothetical protein
LYKSFTFDPLRAGPLLARRSLLSAAKNHISPCGGHDDELLSFGVAILARLGNRRIRRFVASEYG